MNRRTFLASSSFLACSPFIPLPAFAESPDPRIVAFETYQKIVSDTAGMVANPEAQALAQKYGLQILNVTWEDTGRFKGSSVGPNISDMTIQIQQMDPRNEKSYLTAMPVIRYPNFEDITGDIKPFNFYVLVGNEKGDKLKPVSLSELIGDLRSYLHDPKSWKGDERSLLAARDSHVLVSAQACFLPVPKEGKAEFNPVIFNYQSSEKNPAVLTILATREGTSATIIDNKRDPFGAGQTWGQRLFFNKNGKRASLTGQRASDFKNTQPVDPKEQPSVKVGDDGGLNMVLLIQVPLKHKELPMTEAFALGGIAAPAAGADGVKAARRDGSNVENAVIGHGKVEGPYTEIDGMKIERDARFPIRVTVQFYKATSNGVVSKDDIASIAQQIQKVYKQADYVGSLVTRGDTGRPTEHTGEKFQPPGWWDAFWKRHQENTGQSPKDAIDMLRKLYGPNWTPLDQEHLAGAVEALKRK